MDFLSKLTELMRQNGINRMSLAEMSGIPYTTIDGLYKKGYSNTKLSTLKKLSAALNVSIDFLVDDDMDFDSPMSFQYPSATSQDEHDLLETYRSLNAEGQEKLLEYADDLSASGKYIKIDTTNMGQSS